MAAPRVFLMAVRRTVFLAIVLGTAAVALAQPSNVEELGKPLTGWGIDLGNIEKSLENDYLADEALVRLREESEAIRNKADALAEQIRQKLTATQTQLDKLGPAPKAEDPPEPEAVAKERQQLTQQVSNLDGIIKTAQVLQTRAVQLGDQAQDRRRTLFSEQLLKRVSSPFSPRLWGQVGRDLDIAVMTVKLLIADWVQTTPEPRLLIVAIGAGLLTWILLGWLCGRLVHRYHTGNGHEPPPFLRRTASAAGVTLARAVPPVAAFSVLYLTLAGLDLLPGRMQELALSALRAVAVVSPLLALITTVLAPRQPRWRIFPASDAGAARLRWLAAGIAVVCGIELFLNDLNSILVTPLSVTILQKLITTVGIALLLAALLATRIGTQHEARETTSDWQWGWLRGLLWVTVVAILTATALGYVALARFVAVQIVITGSLLCLFYLLHISIEEMSAGLANPETATGRWMSRRLALEPQRREQLGLALSLLLHLLLIGALVPLLLLQWGFGWDDVRIWVTKVLFGFQLGNWNISVATIVVAVLLFIVGLIATRLFQHWLDTGVLKRARFEQGARSAIGTVVGYMGVVLAAIIAFSYTGLDFSSVAIVAGALGVGIGFGLQSIVNNFVSGLILLAERRISVGDWIVVGSDEGHVRRISVRATEIETFDRNYVIIPNSELIAHTVKNWTFRHRRARAVIPVGVSYEADVELVRDLLLACAAEQPDVVDNPAPRVMFDDFGDNALLFQLILFVGDVDKLGNVRSDIRYAILKAFRENNIAMPSPQRELHLKDIDRIERALAGMGQNSFAHAPSADEPIISRPSTKRREADNPGRG